VNANTETPAVTAPEQALAHAALFESLALCFRSRPGESPQTLRGIVDESPERWRPKLLEVAKLMEQVTEEHYLQLFGNGGLCHDCESAYVTNRPAGGLLADVAGFYRAFGYTAACGSGSEPAEVCQGAGRFGNLPHSSSGSPADPIDHIATELSFVSFLFAKEAHAQFGGNVLAADICRRARELFLHEHLGTWIVGFTASVDRNASGSGHERAAALVRDALIELGIGEASRAECSTGLDRQSAGPDDSLCGMCPAAANADEDACL
jgi:hypothetical protein